MITHAIRGRTRYPGAIDSRVLAGIPDLVAWLDLSDPNYLYTDDGITRVVNDGDLVYKVIDKSGNGYHFYQTTDTKRPLYRPLVGLRGAVQFDGSNDVLYYPGFVVSRLNGTMFAVIYLTSSVKKGAVMTTGGKDHGWSLGVGGSSYDNTGNDLILLFSSIKWIDTNDPIGTGAHLLSVTVTNGAPKWYIDGVYSGQATGSPSAPTNESWIGGEGEARFYGDHSCELAYYSVPLTDDNRVVVENYLMTKHGIG